VYKCCPVHNVGCFYRIIAKCIHNVYVRVTSLNFLEQVVTGWWKQWSNNSWSPDRLDKVLCRTWNQVRRTESFAWLHLCCPWWSCSMYQMWLPFRTLSVITYIQGGPKQDCFWELITLTVSGKKACDMSIGSKFCLEKFILCVVCVNI